MVPGIDTGPKKLKLIPDKMKILLRELLVWLVGNLVDLDGVTCPLEDWIRSLRVIMDPALFTEAQISAMASNAFYQHRLISLLCPYLD